jgi:hypothetical protein
MEAPRDACRGLFSDTTPHSQSQGQFLLLNIFQQFFSTYVVRVTRPVASRTQIGLNDAVSCWAGATQREVGCRRVEGEARSQVEMEENRIERVWG